MKTLLTALVLVLTSLELWAQAPGFPSVPATRRPPRIGGTNGLTVPRYPTATPATPGTPGTPGSSLPATAAAAATSNTSADPQANELQPMINWQGVDLNQVLDIYAKYVGRTLIRAALPDAKIILKTETPLTRTETIQAIQAVLALNNISVIAVGEKFVKVLPSDQANAAAAELDRSGSTNLPNMGSYMTHITQLKYVKPSIMMQFITPFAKLPNSVLGIDDNGILVIRDYAENVKRMLEMIDQIDVSVPAEYISEVIPIRYAKVDEIASALNSLGGGGGGATVSIGGSANNSPISGFGGGRSSGLSTMGGAGGIGGGGMGGMSGSGYQSGGGTSAFGNRSGLAGGAANPNGTPTGGTSFAQRLNNIINRASGPGGGAGGGQDQIQLFGQTKIIPNESSSSLLVFATRQDMVMITNIIAKLDVPLAQVLIEAIIMDVKLGTTYGFGVSAAQNPKTLAAGQNPLNSVVGAGGMNNGQPFYNFINSVTNAFPGNFTGTLPSDNNVSYFANLGQKWDLAVQAAETDSHATIIQRPRIQTSQAKPAQFFVGETKPYVTATSYGSAYGNQNSYSQLSVGVELDVTPFINPDGLVVMDIQQEIDDFNGTTTITGVGEVPNTIKRTINAEIAVKDRDTVMLGGFIKSDKSTSKAGVPFLQDIPLLGNLFSSRTDNKDRKELIVLMRPTVLKTPELAAANTVKEQQRLPGVSAAAAEDAAYERKLIDAERKREKKTFNSSKQYEGFFNPEPDAPVTNAPATMDAPAPPTGNKPPTSQPEMQNQSAAPVNSAEAQARARAALAQKMMELDAPTNSAP